ncbi:MAG: VOC family protein [Alphaproteobacteria bacterium]|jgi:catechol 2,3-dioxygenase-like lactoylglutathione lyase family enzyme|nr:VOC family protein [Alphaproteobacteria bacterium]
MSASENPIRLAGLDHVVLRVRDVTAMTRFYCDVLGCTEARMRDELGLYHLQAGGSMIDLVDVAGELGRKGGPAPGPEGNNMDHLCLRVADFDAERLRAHLAAHGIDAGEVLTRYGAAGDGPSLYVTDPEGNTVELKGYPDDA